MATITVNFPTETIDALHRSKEQLSRDVAVAAAIYWYARGELSQERAAQVAGLDRTDFVKACSRAGVSPFQTDAADFLPDSTNRDG